MQQIGVTLFKRLFSLVLLSFFFFNSNAMTFAEFSFEENIPLHDLIDKVESNIGDRRHTFLLRAIVHGSYESILNILEHFKTIGEAIDWNHVRDIWGRTPLHLAVIYHHLYIVEFLLQQGAQPNVRDCLGKTPLHYLSTHVVQNCESSIRDKRTCNTTVRIFQSLYLRGTDVNTTDHFDNTPLHVAAECGNVCFYDYLVKHGANENSENFARVKSNEMSELKKRLDERDTLRKNHQNVLQEYEVIDLPNFLS